jgi:hypothetical protein
MKAHYINLLIAVLLISGCQTVTPTSDSASVKNTQIAFAWTVIAQTVLVDHFEFETATPTPTPISLATFRIPVTTPIITATPITAKVSTDEELNFIIRKRIYRYPCFGYNFAKEPLTEVNHASKLNFVEVNFQPDSQKYIVEELAYNTNGSRRAWIACDNGDHCEDKIYVQDNKTEKVYEITWEDQMLWRPIQWITWINNDILTLLQSANPDHALVMAINVDKREVLYEGIIFPDYVCTTPTPTP